MCVSELLPEHASRPPLFRMSCEASRIAPEGVAAAACRIPPLTVTMLPTGSGGRRYRIEDPPAFIVMPPVKLLVPLRTRLLSMLAAFVHPGSTGWRRCP